MERAVFLEQLAKILEEDSLTEDQEVTPKVWDSIEILGAIALIDKAGKTVRVADILACGSVGDLWKLAEPGA